MYAKKEVNPIAPSNNKRWTKNDDQILRQMVKEKATTAQVAIVLGRTKSSVWGRKSFLGLDGRLSSSKGKGITAPTTLRTRTRSKSTVAPVIKAKKRRKPGSTVVQTSVQSLDFTTLSRMAKESGAKIVITFE
jgi:hypothetical protein